MGITLTSDSLSQMSEEQYDALGYEDFHALLDQAAQNSDFGKELQKKLDETATPMGMVPDYVTFMRVCQETLSEQGMLSPGNGSWSPQTYNRFAPTPLKQGDIPSTETIDIEIADLKSLNLPDVITYHLDAGQIGETDHPSRDGWGDFLMPAWAHAMGYGHLTIQNFSLDRSLTNTDRLQKIRHEIYNNRMSLKYDYSDCRRYLPELEKVVEFIAQKMGVAYQPLPADQVPQYNLAISVSQLSKIQQGGTVWGVDTKDKGIFEVHLNTQAISDLLTANGLKPDSLDPDSQEFLTLKISRDAFGSVNRIPTISRADEPLPKPILELKSEEGNIMLTDYQSHLSDSKPLPAYITHLEEAQELLFVIGMLIAPIASRGAASDAMIGEMNRSAPPMAYKVVGRTPEGFEILKPNVEMPSEGEFSHSIPVEPSPAEPTSEPPTDLKVWSHLEVDVDAPPTPQTGGPLKITPPTTIVPAAVVAPVITRPHAPSISPGMSAAGAADPPADEPPTSAAASTTSVLTYEQLEPVWAEQDTALRTLSPEDRLVYLDQFEVLASLQPVEGTKNYSVDPTPAQVAFWGGAENYAQIVQAEFGLLQGTELTQEQRTLAIKSKSRMAQLRIDAEREIYLRDHGLASHLDRSEFTDPRSHVMTWYSVGREPSRVTALLPEAIQYGVFVDSSPNTDVWAIDVPENMEKEVIGGGRGRQKIRDDEGFNPQAYGLRHIGVLRDGELIFDEGANVVLYGDIQMGNTATTDYTTMWSYVAEHGDLPPSARREVSIPGGTVWTFPTESGAGEGSHPIYYSYAAFAASHDTSTGPADVAEAPEPSPDTSPDTSPPVRTTETEKGDIVVEGVTKVDHGKSGGDPDTVTIDFSKQPGVPVSDVLTRALQADKTYRITREADGRLTFEEVLGKKPPQKGEVRVESGPDGTWQYSLWLTGATQGLSVDENIVRCVVTDNPENLVGSLTEIYSPAWVAIEIIASHGESQKRAVINTLRQVVVQSDVLVNRIKLRSGFALDALLEIATEKSSAGVAAHLQLLDLVGLIQGSLDYVRGVYTWLDPKVRVRLYTYVDEKSRSKMEVIDKKSAAYQSAYDPPPPPGTGANLAGRTRVVELQAQEKEVLRIGETRHYFTHGITANDGGLRNIFDIIVDGQTGGIDQEINPSFMSMENTGFGAFTPYSPFHVVIDQNGLDKRKSTDKFIAYLVPEVGDREVLWRALDKAVEHGLISREYADREKTKVMTYEEFIARDGEPFTSAPSAEASGTPRRKVEPVVINHNSPGSLRHEFPVDTTAYIYIGDKAHPTRVIGFIENKDRPGQGLVVTEDNVGGISQWDPDQFRAWQTRYKDEDERGVVKRPLPPHSQIDLVSLEKEFPDGQKMYVDFYGDGEMVLAEVRWINKDGTIRLDRINDDPNATIDGDNFKPEDLRKWNPPSNTTVADPTADALVPPLPGTSPENPQALMDEAQALIASWDGNPANYTYENVQATQRALVRAHDLFEAAGDTINAARAEELLNQHFSLQGEAPDPTAGIDFNLTLLTYPDPTVRWQAGKDLVQLIPELPEELRQPLIEKVTQKLDDPDENTRLVMVDVLRDVSSVLSDEECLPLAKKISERLDDADENVRLMAVDAMGDMIPRVPESEQLALTKKVVEKLEDADPDVRRVAVDTLRNILPSLSPASLDADFISLLFTKILTFQQESEGVQRHVPQLESLAKLLLSRLSLTEATILLRKVPSTLSSNDIVDRLRHLAELVDPDVPGFLYTIHNHPSPDNVDYIREKLEASRGENPPNEELIGYLEESLTLAEKIYEGKLELSQVAPVLSKPIRDTIKWPTSDSPTLEELGDFAVSIREAFDKNENQLSTEDRYVLIRLAISANVTAYATASISENENVETPTEARKMACLLRVMYGCGFGDQSGLVIADRFEEVADDWETLGDKEAMRQLRLNAALVYPLLENFQKTYENIYGPLVRDYSTALEISDEKKLSYVSDQYRASGIRQLSIHLDKLGVTGGNQEVARQVVEHLSRENPVPVFKVYMYGENSFPTDERVTGGKGWGLNYLAEKVPDNTPPGFLLPPRPAGHQLTDGEKTVIRKGIEELEKRTGKKLGEGLLVSVRSGAAISMPGQMHTELNVKSLEDVYDWVQKVYDSWDSEGARAYRLRNGIPDEWNTAINIVAMVDGTLNAQSGSGIALSSLELKYGQQVTGKELVDGTHAGNDPLDPELNRFLQEKINEFENGLGYPVQIEFTVEDGKLYFLQIRRAPLEREQEITWHAKKVAEGQITKEEAIKKLGGKDKLEKDKQVAKFNLTGKERVVTEGSFGGGKVYTGVIATSSEEIAAIQKSGALAVYVTDNPDAKESASIAMEAGAVIVAGGNPLAHLFDVARHQEITYVGGIENKKSLPAGTKVSIDPRTGKIYAGELPIIKGENPALTEIEYLLGERDAQPPSPTIGPNEKTADGWDKLPDTAGKAGDPPPDELPPFSMEALRQSLEASGSFTYRGITYKKPKDVLGNHPEFEPAQHEISVGRLNQYIEAMKAGRWNWENMQVPNIDEELVDDPIEILITPSGRKIIGNGHHRYFAAKLTGTPIPESAFHYKTIDYEPKPISWDTVDWLWVDPHGVYPILTPPYNVSEKKASPPPSSWPARAKYNYPIRKVDGVYPPDLFAARVLDATLPNVQTGQHGLVLCTGAGLEAVTLAKEKGVSVDAVDINDAAVVSTNQAARDNGVESLVHAWKSDGFDQVPGQYDFIIYSGPVPRSIKDIRGTADANYHDVGGDLLRRTLANLSSHLNPGGVLYLITDEELIFSVPAGYSKEVVADVIVWNMPMTIYAIREK